ncbi:MAG: VanZ family protein [Desulfobacter postgatei]|uniref:VanZ family protein n=1 Tax=Desulfobacter postgatei TaxID=2293 RepID=UPI0023F43030|nr:VanZ family protein [Desulfobacter postgatei]MDD4273145.1 VanZ family protein [Desulfobacter postgatei]
MNNIASRLIPADGKAPVKIVIGAFLFIGAAVVMAEVLSLILHFPGIPYNVRELFRDHGSFFRIFIFSCALLWTGLSAALVTDRVVRSKFFYVLLPLLICVSGICSYFLLSAGVTHESISDLVGSSNIYWFVMNKHIWGDWGVCLFQAIGSSQLISVIERYVRYLALYCPIIFFLVICSVAIEKSTLKGSVKILFHVSLASLPWLILSKVIAFDYSSTDNLNELIASDAALGMGGGVYLYLLVILIIFNSVYISKNPTGPLYKYIVMVMLTFAGVLTSWYFLNFGLVANFKKYDVAYSGVDFLLGPDRKTKLPESVLFLRWGVLYICAISVLTWGQIVFSFGNILLRHKKNRDDASGERGLPRSLWIKIFWVVCFIIAYGSFFPFNFQFNMEQLIQDLKNFFSFNSRSGLSDTISNFVLFLPFGFIGAKAFGDLRYSSGIIFISGILFAYGLQVVQIFIPERIPSLRDVLWNAAGCTAGEIGARWIKLPTFQEENKPHFARFYVQVGVCACWIVSQLIPFVPSIDLQAIKTSLKPLLIYHEFSWSSCLAYTGCWLTAGSFASDAFRPRRPGLYFILAAAMVLCLQTVIVTRSVSVSNFLGTILAMILWILFFNRAKMKPRTLLVVILTVIFINGFFPLQFTAPSGSFQFMPFHGFLSGNMLNNSITLFEKIFIYAGLVVLLRILTQNHIISVSIACFWVLLIEVLQMFTLNHSPEITDPLMVVVIAVLIDRAERW